VSRGVRVVGASQQLSWAGPVVGVVEKTTVGGPSGDLVSLVGREIAGVFSTRHPEGSPKWWASTYYYTHTLHSIPTGVSKHLLRMETYPKTNSYMGVLSLLLQVYQTTRSVLVAGGLAADGRGAPREAERSATPESPY
jgi:hypothetical protein